MNWDIVGASIGWLRYKQRCFLVCWERSPFDSAYFYRPDVCGVTRDRKVIEIEIKQSVADFKANASKRGIQWRNNGWALGYPVRFYYAVPPLLVDKVRELLCPGDGLLTVGRSSRWGPEIEVVVGAKNDKRATKLTPIQIGRMVMHQSACLHRAVLAIGEKVEAQSNSAIPFGAPEHAAERKEASPNESATQSSAIGAVKLPVGCAC